MWAVTAALRALWVSTLSLCWPQDSQPSLRQGPVLGMLLLTLKV